MLKFQDDPTVNESKIIIFLGQVWWYAGRERVLGGEEGKTKMTERNRIDYR